MYPAHDYLGQTVTSIGEEKAFNPRLGNQATREEYVKLMDALVLDKPKLIDEAVPGNFVCGIQRQDGK